MEWDAATDVPMMLARSMTNWGWRIADSKEDQKNNRRQWLFWSREYTTAAYRPQLVIYSPSSLGMFEIVATAGDQTIETHTRMDNGQPVITSWEFLP